MTPEQEDQQRDYQIVFGSDEGRRVLADICNECGMWRPHGEDISFDEGMRNAALMILGKVRGDNPTGLAFLGELIALSEDMNKK